MSASPTSSAASTRTDWLPEPLDRDLKVPLDLDQKECGDFLRTLPLATQKQILAAIEGGTPPESLLRALGLAVEHHTAPDDRSLRHPDWKACEADPVHWMNGYAKTYNPRLLPADPFIDLRPYPRQIDLIRWIADLETTRAGSDLDIAVEGVIEKSRNVGV